MPSADLSHPGLKGSASKGHTLSYLALLKQRQILDWAMYDWANSAFSTIVVSALLGPYMSNCARALGGLDFWGIHLEPDSVFPLFVTVSVILQLFLLPGLGALADVYNKKFIMIVCAVAGAILTCFIGGFGMIPGRPAIVIDGVIFVLANLFFGASVTVYNSFLPDLAPVKLRDKVSSLGWAAGYLGGGCALAITMLAFRFFEDAGLAVRTSFFIAGMWWLLFTLLFPARMKWLPSKDRVVPGLKRIFCQGTLEPLRTILNMRSHRPNAWRFLLAYFFYNDGVQTVIVVASIFAVSQLGVESKTLLQLMLFIQFVAILGSILFGWIGERFGTKNGIIFSLAVWIGIVFYAYAFLDSVSGLFVLGFFVAMVLGGTQALSRSLFSRLIPTEKEAEYFGFYEISEKGSSWLGPLVFAICVQITGSTQAAMLSIGVFFILGALLLLRVRS